MAPPTQAERVAVVAGSFFGTGYAPIASGTVATAAAIPLYLALAFLPPPGSGPWIYLGVTLLVALGGAVAAGVMERRLGIDDPSEVVIDEVAGFLVAMLLVPPGLLTITCGFLLFRVFDIVKPWPAGPAERIGGGWGIMADDIVCGIYTNLLLQAGIRVFA